MAERDRYFPDIIVPIVNSPSRGGGLTPQSHFSELDAFFPRSPFTAFELYSRLQNTPEYRIFKENPPQSGTRLSISQVEGALPWILKRLNYDIDLPRPPSEKQLKKSYESSVIGSALHEASVLYSLLLLKAKLPEDQPVDVPTIAATCLPSYKEEKLSPFIRAVQETPDFHEISEDGAIVMLVDAWERFRKDPELATVTDMDPLIKTMDFKDHVRELDIRKSKEVREAGIHLAHYYANLAATPDSKIPWYSEVMVILNLRSGLQITGRLDGLTPYKDENEEQKVQVTDLKTGRKKIDNLVASEVHKWQSEIMIVLSERFTAKYMKEGKLERQDEPFLLINIDHFSKTGNGMVNLNYNWFDKETGDVEPEELAIEDRSMFNEQLYFLSQAVNIFKPELKEYLRTGIYKNIRRVYSAPNSENQDYKQMALPVPKETPQIPLELIEDQPKYKRKKLKKNKESEMYTYTLGKPMLLGQTCRECGSQLEMTARMKVVGAKKSRIMLNTYCPEHGSLSLVTKNVANEDIADLRDFTNIWKKEPRT